MADAQQTYEFEENAGYSVFTLKPAMNDAEWGAIEKVGDEIVGKIEAQKSPNLIADLSDLEYIGSSMVALIVRVWKIVKGKQGRMVVVNRNPMVMEVLQISKLDAFWTIVEYREDALYELGVSEEAKVEQRESNVLVMVSVFVSLAAVAGLALHLAKIDLLNERTLQILAYGCSSVGVVLGLILFFKGYGGRRAIGAISAVVSLAVLGGAVYSMVINTDEKPLVKEKEPDDDDGRPTVKSKTPKTPNPQPQPAKAEKPVPDA